MRFNTTGLSVSQFSPVSPMIPTISLSTLEPKTNGLCFEGMTLLLAEAHRIKPFKTAAILVWKLTTANEK